MVQLVPMAEEDYQQFVAWAIPDYAQEQVKSGTWQTDNAIDLAKKVFDSLLPEGLATQNQFLCVIEDDTSDQKVGYIWYGVREEGVARFIGLYELVVFEEHRRQGYGSAALRALDEKAKELGIKQIVLHVFGHNKGAHALYLKSGYKERNITMIKDLS